jgi:hypothetical protein
MVSQDLPPVPQSIGFRYSTAPLDLSSHEIRLVELQQNASSSVPTCVLRSYPVNGPHPPYVALSYAWGINVSYAGIELNGSPFPVAKNLWDFLVQMRSDERYAVYWIDAICIDQTNVDERNHQVQMMRQIYSNAASVSVWLGEDDPITNSNTAMNYLTTREPYRHLHSHLFWNQRQAKAVLALYNRPYWTRMWIVQEILLAKDIIIYCGPKIMSWQHVQNFFNDIVKLPAVWKQHYPITPVLKSPAANIVKAKTTWDGQQSLTSLLRLCRDQRSSDSRDKIYALHGLANDTEHLKIDYGISVEQLLVIVLEHTCAPLRASLDAKDARKGTKRVRRLLQHVLEVQISDEELQIEAGN